MAENVFYATGRRKAAIARIWLFRDQKGIFINNTESRQYLQRDDLQILVDEPLKVAQLQEQFRVRARVQGGGVAGQAHAVQLGIARALVRFDETLKPLMRKNGFLTRNPREKERKKFGHKGARKSFQYTKR